MWMSWNKSIRLILISSIIFYLKIKSITISTNKRRKELFALNHLMITDRPCDKGSSWWLSAHLGRKKLRNLYKLPLYIPVGTWRCMDVDTTLKRLNRGASTLFWRRSPVGIDLLPGIFVAFLKHQNGSNIEISKKKNHKRLWGRHQIGCT